MPLFGVKYVERNHGLFLASQRQERPWPEPGSAIKFWFLSVSAVWIVRISDTEQQLRDERQGAVRPHLVIVSLFRKYLLCQALQN